MKVGDMIRNRGPNRHATFQVFAEVFGDWLGTVIFLKKGAKYFQLQVLLSSHEGLVCKTWLTAGEIKENIEVLYAAR